MEEENQVFGKNAEAIDNNKNLESEDFYFYNQNKEEAKKNIDSSSKDLTDLIDSLIQDVPAPSEEEVNAGIEKILERTHPVEEQPQKAKSRKSKKVTFKVLFIAALLSILSVSCLFVVGSSHNISIENGFISFAKDTIQIVFFGETKEEYITVDALLDDLEQHGYGDILFPQEFVTKSDEYKVSVPVYLDADIEQVSFNVYDNATTYTFIVHCFDPMQQAFDYVDIDNVQTVIVDDINMYIFNFDNNDSVVEFVYKKYRYRVQGKISCSELLKILETINKGER